VEVNGHRSAGIARWDGTPTAVLVQDLETSATDDGIRVAWHVASSAASGIESVRIERSQGDEPFVSRGTYDASSLERSPGAYEWTDREVTPGVRYAYRIGIQESSGEITWAGPVSATSAAVAWGISPIAIPRHGDAMRIDYGIPTAGQAALDVYDVRGRLVRQLAAGRLAAGRYTAHWDRTKEDGSRVASGVYFLRLQMDAREAVRRVVLAN
jgi:hypothetical protein